MLPNPNTASVLLVLLLFVASVGAVSAGDSMTGNVQECTPTSWEPSLRTLSLQTTSASVTLGERQRLVGRFEPVPESNCPVVVALTLMFKDGIHEVRSVPSSRSEQVSTDPRTRTYTYRVTPGEIREIDLLVSSSSVGTHHLVVDITYYPLGHRSQARNVTGVDLTYEVAPAATAPPPAATVTSKPTAPVTSTSLATITHPAASPIAPGADRERYRFRPELVIVGLAIVFGSLLVSRRQE